jgi:hypothetical protein
VLFKFPQYSYRHFGRRRVREHFELNRSVNDPVLLAALYKVFYTVFFVLRYFYIIS